MTQDKEKEVVESNVEENVTPTNSEPVAKSLNVKEVMLTTDIEAHGVVAPDFVEDVSNIEGTRIYFDPTSAENIKGHMY